MRLLLLVLLLFFSFICSLAGGSGRSRRIQFDIATIDALQPPSTDDKTKREQQQQTNKQTSLQVKLKSFYFRVGDFVYLPPS
eukprot:gene5890-4207_t